MTNSMEAVIVFDPSNFPVLTRCSAHFLDCVAQLAVKHGLCAATSKPAARRQLALDEEQFKNLLVMMFAPFVASVRILRHKTPACSLLNDVHKNAKVAYVEVSALEFEKVLIAGSQHFDHMLLYVYDVNSVRNARLVERRLLVFKEMAAFLFGANARSAKFDARQSALLKSMFECWMQDVTKPANLVEVGQRVCCVCSPNSNFAGRRAAAVGRRDGGYLRTAVAVRVGQESRSVASVR